jgi:hypothetical protein
MPEHDYSTNPLFTMIEEIKAHVREHGTAILVDDAPLQREIGFCSAEGSRWGLNLSKVKASFTPELDPENRLASYKMYIGSTGGRQNIAEMLTNGTVL